MKKRLQRGRWGVYWLAVESQIALGRLTRAVRRCMNVDRGDSFREKSLTISGMRKRGSMLRRSVVSLFFGVVTTLLAQVLPVGTVDGTVKDSAGGLLPRIK